jgi:hypothetical protein
LPANLIEETKGFSHCGSVAQHLRVALVPPRLFPLPDRLLQPSAAIQNGRQVS